MINDLELFALTPDESTRYHILWSSLFFHDGFRFFRRFDFGAGAVVVGIIVGAVVVTVGVTTVGTIGEGLAVANGVVLVREAPAVREGAERFAKSAAESRLSVAR